MFLLCGAAGALGAMKAELIPTPQLLQGILGTGDASEKVESNNEMEFTDNPIGDGVDDNDDSGDVEEAKDADEQDDKDDKD